MEPLRVLAIDPAMANLGWMVLEFDPDQIAAKTSPDPGWITQKDLSGIHTYQCFTRLAGGVCETDKSLPLNARLVSQVDSVHLLVDLHQPDLLAFETQLEATARQGRGINGGLAIVFGMIFPYFDIKERPVRLARSPDFSYIENPTAESFHEISHIPLYVVGIHPAQLNSIAHHEKSIKDKIVLERYRYLTDEVHRMSVHEADAYFIGVHAARFWAVGLEGCWGREYLTTKEREVFLNPYKGMIGRKYDCWWNNF